MQHPGQGYYIFLKIRPDLNIFYQNPAGLDHFFNCLDFITKVKYLCNHELEAFVTDFINNPLNFSYF